MEKAFINSLPKSGTNLMAKCLELFGYRQKGQLSAGVALKNSIKTKIKKLLWLPVSKNGFLLGIVSPVMVRKPPVISRLKKIESNQFIVAHVGYTDDLLLQVKRMKFKIIVMIRDPRAVVASSVPYILKSHKHRLNKYFKSISKQDCYLTVINGMIDRNISCQSISTRCYSLNNWIKSPDTLVVRFEELVGREGGGNDSLQEKTLYRICNFLNIKTSKIRKVKNELFGPGRHTFRKGKIDSWREEIPGDIIKTMNEKLRHILVRWGYEK